MAAANLTQINLDLTAARREQRERLRRLADPRREIRDVQALCTIGRREVARLDRRRIRAVAKASTPTD